MGAMRKKIDRTEERFGLKTDWVAADTSYESSDHLVWLTLKRKILSFIPVFDKGECTDGTVSRSDFTWDEENDRDFCPEGKEMRHTRQTYSDPARNAPRWKSRNDRALKGDCMNCPSKAKGCPSAEARANDRGKYEIVRDFARQCVASEFNPTARKRRKKGRCSSHISNASPDWAGSDGGDHAAFKMISPSQQPPKISGNWQNSSQWLLPPDDKVGQQQTAMPIQHGSSQKRAKTNELFNKISCLCRILRLR